MDEIQKAKIILILRTVTKYVHGGFPKGLGMTKKVSQVLIYRLFLSVIYSTYFNVRVLNDDLVWL